MTADEGWRRLLPLMTEMFPEARPPLRPDMCPADVMGWDSFRMVMMAMRMEEEFGVFIGRAIGRVRTLGDFVGFLPA